MLLRILAGLAAMTLLAACASTVVPQGSAPPLSTQTGQAATRPAQAAPPPQSRPRPQQPTAPGFRAPRIMALDGVEGLIGARAERLIAQFGSPRLDVYEGDARKLQFGGDACLLDIYLYPTSPGAEPTATYVDARRASDGLDVDRAACVRALLGQ